MPSTYYEKSKRIYEPMRKWADKFTSDNPEGSVDLFKGSLAEVNALIISWIRMLSTEGGVYDIHSVLNSRAIACAWALFEGKGLGEGAIVSYMTELWQYACFQASGEQTYDVSPGLAEHLFATEVRNVKCDYLRLPFKSIYINVPRSAKLILPYTVALAIERDLPVAMRDVGKAHESNVEGIWVTEIPSSRIQHTYHKHGWSSGRGWVFSIIGAGEYPEKLYEGIAGSVRKLTKSGLPDNVIYTFELPLPDGGTVQDALNIRNAIIEKGRLRGDRNPADVKWEHYFTWVMNLILYLTYEPGKEVEEYWDNKHARHLKDRIKVARDQGKHSKAERLKQELKQLDPERRIYVGRHHPRLEDAETKDDGGGIKEHRHLNVRVLVSGHWRNQAHGTAWQDHKLIWIKPFWRGPPGAPISLPYRRVAT